MDISKYIDHTLLKPDSTEAQIIQLCQEAIQYKFRSVCIPPYYIKTAVSQLEKYNNIKTSTVIGFPLGYYFCVQGSLIIFVALIFFQNWKQDKIDDEAGLSGE